METKFEITVDDLKKIQEPVIRLDNGLLAVQDGYKINRDFMTKEVDMDRPARVKVSPVFSNALDFIDFVSEYKETGSKAFYDDSNINVIFNYPKPDMPDYGDSNARLALYKTEVFNTFIRELRNNPGLSQKGLIRFFKQMESVVTSHDGITLYNIIENLKAVKDVQSISKNTEKGVVFNVKVDTGIENVRIPDKITVKLPIYKANPDILTEFEIELFYNFDDSKGFDVEIVCWDLESVIEKATKELVDGIVAKMEVKAYRI